MAAAAGLTITLVPVLIGLFIRGQIRPEQKNPVNRFLSAAYLPVLKQVLVYPKSTVAIALVILASTLWPMTKIGNEFMPPLDEGARVRVKFQLETGATSRAG